MAATWLRPLHIRKGRTIIQAITERTGYAKNPEKTDGGLLVKGYACDPRTVDEEFMLAKREYERNTGRNNGNKNVILYHLRQSFRPGEITPEEALDVGYETAMRWLKGKHAFIVCIHTDREHLHCAIVYNSTNLDCDGKFNNFKNSSFAVRRLSDLVCAEHGLSVIENPKPSKGRNYAEWLGDKEPSWQEKLRRKIDEVLPACSSFADFLAAMRAAEYVISEKRKHITFMAPGQKKPTRLDTLKGDYTEAAIRERLGMTRIVAGSGAGQRDAVTYTRHTDEPQKVSLLIDIQAKIQEGKGAGYERWARIFNLKESARTLLFLKENGIDSYDDLVKKAAAASVDFEGRMTRIKATEKRMAEITELQKHIGVYGKTKNVYARYKASGWNPDFYEEHREHITLHRAAKKHFDDRKIRKLPTFAALQQEYAALAGEKKKLYNGYREAKDNLKELLTAKGNAQRLLGIDRDERERGIARERTRSAARDR